MTRSFFDLRWSFISWIPKIQPPILKPFSESDIFSGCRQLSKKRNVFWYLIDLFRMFELVKEKPSEFIL